MDEVGLTGDWRGDHRAVSTAGCAKIGEVMGMFKFKQANQAYSAQDYERASRLYEETIGNDPNNAIVYLYLGNSYDNLYKPGEKGEAGNDASCPRLSITTSWPSRSSMRTTRAGQDQGARSAVSDGGVRSRQAGRPGQGGAGHHSSHPARSGRARQLLPARKALRGRRRVRGGRKGATSRRRTPSRPMRTSTCSSPAITAARAVSTRRSQAFEQRADREPNNPEGFYTVATRYWDQAYRGAGVKDADKRNYVDKGIKAIDHAIEIKPDYVEALVYKNLLLRLPGQPREGSGQAAGAHQAGRRAPRQGRGDSQAARRRASATSACFRDHHEAAGCKPGGLFCFRGQNR